MPGEQDKAVAKKIIHSDWATRSQVEECLRRQKNLEEKGSSASLLEILVEQEYISPHQRTTLLKAIKKQRLFGEIAAEMGIITREQLEECLELQKRLQTDKSAQGVSKLIGEILFSKGYITEKQIKVVLKDQKKELPQEKENPKLATCKHCGAKFNIKLLAGGRKLKCGKCGKTLEATKKQNKNKNKLTLSLNQLMRSRRKKISIPGYTILQVLGEDSTGMTYKACYTLDKNQEVVIKLYNKETCEDKEFMAKLELAVKRASTLQIPNIRKNYGISRSKDKKGAPLIYIVSEYIKGESIGQLLEKGTEVSVKKALTIITRLAKILKYAYQEGVLHGDIAPHNVIISKEGKVILTNLGVPNKVIKNIFKVVEQQGATSLYLAPEMLSENQPIDHRSDIYSLGVLFYQLLAKNPPFVGNSPFEILNRVTEEVPLPPLQVFNSDVPESISRIVEKMLEIDPNNRYDNYATLIHDLQHPTKAQSTVSYDDVIEEEVDDDEKPLTLRAAKEKVPQNPKEAGTLERKQATQIPWGKLTLLGIALLIGGYLYSNHAHAKKQEKIQEEFLFLRKKVTKLQGTLEGMKKAAKKLKSYN